MALEEGWEYAKTRHNQLHPEPKLIDMFRRRRWLRQMIATETRGSVFQLDRPLVVRKFEIEGNIRT